MNSLTGDEELIKNIARFGLNVESVVRDAVYSTANNVRTNAIRSIQKRTMGNIYRISRQGGGTKETVAGKIGEAPNTQTGRLVSSIAVEKMFGRPAAYVGTSVEYGKYLEFNNHPWLEPAAEEERSKFIDTLEKVVNRQIRKAQR